MFSKHEIQIKNFAKAVFKIRIRRETAGSVSAKMAHKEGKVVDKPALYNIL